jgi:mRNA-degrading endonuclease RelE of RelBE toxin-antitoxin system
MTWLVAWSDRAERTWKSLPPRDAKLVAAGAVAFTERGEGRFEIASREPAITGVLFVGRFELFVVIDEAESAVRVLWMRRST